MMRVFKKNYAEKAHSEQRKQLELEVERQGVLAIASRLDTADEQREFINDYWIGRYGYETIAESEEKEND